MTETPTENAHGFRQTAAAEVDSPDPVGFYEMEADIVKALAHPKRLLVVDLLSDGEERNVGELQELTGLSQSNLSQNLSILRTAGVLTARRDGNVVYYRLTDPRVLKSLNLLRAFLLDRFEDRQFQAERAAKERKKRFKGAALRSFLVLAGIMVLGTFLAIAHPWLAGAPVQEIPAHAQLMLNSPNLQTLMDVCATAATSPQDVPMDARMPV